MDNKSFKRDDKVLISTKKDHLPLMGIVREFDAGKQQVRVVLNDEGMSAMLQGKSSGNLPGSWYPASEVEAFTEAAMLRALFGKLVPIVE